MSFYIAENNQLDSKVSTLIKVLSVIIPAAVALLFGIKIDTKPLDFLPPFYASVNAFASLILVSAFIAIKFKYKRLHIFLMKIALLLGAVFLISYVAYHMTSDPAIFGDIDHDGLLSSSENAAIANLKMFYYGLLISHIILSIGVVPLVLTTFAKGLAGQMNQHKKIARIAFPLWLYVTVTGVVIYLMISPYYRLQ